MTALGIVTGLAGIRRWAVPAFIAALSLALVWFAFQTQRFSSEADTLRTKVTVESKRADDAEKFVGDLVEARRLAEIATAADQDRLRELETAVERQKGTINALEKKYGASPVSDLTREHLRRLRAAQR